MTNTEINEAERIKLALQEAADDTCECCQGETLKRVQTRDWSRWLEFDIDGKYARIQYRAQIVSESITVINKPTISANHMSGEEKLHERT